MTRPCCDSKAGQATPPETQLAHPPISDRASWRAARVQLLEKEKALTRQYDALNAERRRLPMVKLEKDYRFKGPAPRDAEATLLDLFQGRRQLIVYHFMFDPAWEQGCDGCTDFVDSLGDLTKLNERDTSFALVSRAPVATFDPYRQAKGWKHDWYSSFGSDFNYDFHATLDHTVAPIENNFREKPDSTFKGESHGLSVFFRMDRDIFHTYSSYARGVERLTDAYSLLDVTPYGRQEDFEDSPAGWPQKPTYG
ncbi:DUF899 domain-containing protein [Phycisphaerales bacterium AB-hyl4]|uniref:DUF899 domain-containing protein n=1 Tax=Natronomicrosphaera hydrolytica TaxID=3242702 RepID=A0ABV4U8L4_9BACT